MVEPIILLSGLILSVTAGIWISARKIALLCRYKTRENDLLIRADYCAICLSAPNNPQILKNCGHVFCGDCIRAHRIRTYGMSRYSCPMCRTRLDDNERPPAQQRDTANESTPLLPSSSYSASWSDDDDEEEYSEEDMFDPVAVRVHAERALSRGDRQTAQVAFQQLEAAEEAHAFRYYWSQQPRHQNELPRVPSVQNLRDLYLVANESRAVRQESSA